MKPELRATANRPARTSVLPPAFLVCTVFLAALFTPTVTRAQVCLPAPAVGATNRPALLLASGGVVVVLEEFSRSKVLTADEREAYATRSAPVAFNRLAPTFIRLEIRGRRDGMAVDIVRLKSDMGDEPRLTLNRWQPGVREMGFGAISTNARTVDITVAIQRCRTVEFLLKPPAFNW